MISRGSEWHRWEPHIHAPGTVLNNQFGATDPWESYLSTIEGLTPKVEAIAVTDYYVTDTYEALLKHRAAGRLPDVALLFPNIELRLDVAAKSGFVNNQAFRHLPAMLEIELTGDIGELVPVMRHAHRRHRVPANA